MTLLLTGLVTGCSASAPSTAAPATSEIDSLLARHGKAVLGHDRSTFLTDLDPDRRAAGFRSAQAASFDNLVTLPLTSWSWTLNSRVDAADAQAAARKRYGPSAVIMQVTLAYALRAVDPVPTKHDVWWTFVRVGGHVRVASDSDLADAGGVSWKGPWDFGDLVVQRGAHSLVLGHIDNADVLAGVAALVDAAVPDVTAVWGPKWSQDVAVFVPASKAELRVALGATSAVSTDIAAVAENDGLDPVTGSVLGARLVVETAALTRLSDVGRRIVVTHEVTHIADGNATTDATPRWIAEGFADYVGNLHSGQPVTVAATELRADVRRGRLPTALPKDAAFDIPATAAQSYEASWLACRLIAARAGAAGLVRFYRMVGASPQAPDGAVADALRAVLHVGVAAFVAQWRTYLRAQLA